MLTVFEQPGVEFEVEPQEIKVMHWNVLHASPADEVIKVIEETNPDILLLNETALARPKYHNDNLFEKLRDNLTIGGNHAVTQSHTLIPKGGEHKGRIAVIDGNSIFSRFPLSNVIEVQLSSGGWDPDHAGERRTMYLGATLDTGGVSPLDVGTNHRSLLWAKLGSIRNRQNWGIRKRETSRLNDILGYHKVNYIISGDWNATTISKPVRHIHSNVTRIDGELNAPTVRPTKKLGVQLRDIRVDYILKTPDLIEIESSVGEFDPSDHTPLHLTIQQTR